LLPETHFISKDMQTESGWMENDIPSKWNLEVSRNIYIHNQKSRHQAKVNQKRQRWSLHIGKGNSTARRCTIINMYVLNVVHPIL
jgi:hypothetical protein